MSAFNLAPTGCCQTASPFCIYDQGGTTATPFQCYTCSYYVSNIRSSPSVVSNLVVPKVKKSKNQVRRDALQKLPGNRKSMRY